MSPGPMQTVPGRKRTEFAPIGSQKTCISIHGCGCSVENEDVVVDIQDVSSIAMPSAAWLLT